MNKLDEKGLERLDFYDSGEKDTLGRTKWRLKVPYYNFEIQMVLGPYHTSNPNCGILSLYSPAEHVPGFSKKGKKTMVYFKEREIPIAWYVDTYDRLRNIIISLSQQNL